MIRIVIDVNTPAGYAQAVKEDIAMHLERWGDARVVAVEELQQGGTMMENQMSMATVMVVQAPGRAEADLRGLRDYILESLNQGVLVLGAGMSYQLEKFPELGAVRITSVDILRGNKELLRRAAPTGTGSGRLKKSEEEIRAAQSQEKKAILARLQEYRQANGLGCFKALAQKTGKLSAETLLSVVTGNQVLPIEDWRKIGRALDKMGTAHG